MSAGGADAVEPASPLDDLPKFDLEYDLDDPVEPTEVTVYEVEADDQTTHWITAGVDAAVDLLDVA